MKLTELDAVKISKDLWCWLYYNPDKNKSDYPDFYNLKINNMSSYCPMCEYFCSRDNRLSCDDCILSKNKNCGCGYNGENIFYFSYFLWKETKDLQIRKVHAKEIWSTLCRRYIELLKEEVNFDLKGYKVYCKDEETSRKVHKHAINLGYKCRYNTERSYRTDYPFLLFSYDKKISYMKNNYFKLYKEDNKIELTPEEFLKLI
jgi:hypothetical protein